MFDDCWYQNCDKINRQKMWIIMTIIPYKIAGFMMITIKMVITPHKLMWFYDHDKKVYKIKQTINYNGNDPT